MQANNLIRMANQIGVFFEAMPDRPAALESLILHIRKFWAPSMRHALLDQLEGTGDAGLTPMVAEAIRLYRDQLC
ncbi:MAG: formate dehydrogenase [Burkholderiaceae bacterium]|nr:formate dehydrogenase subunit delta [Burkholderiales bacterium]TAL69403.1 MAG: formate dehydrogenase [Burkholderiaceae bacterium]TBR77304.1 MAG: formate dehydrogenase [Burkholderiaceae bacterium]